MQRNISCEINTTAMNWLQKMVRDDKFVRNAVVLMLLAFLLYGAISMYKKGELSLDHFLVAMDVAIGTLVGGYLIRALEGKP